MNKKQITVMTILTLVLAFMDISGLPAVLFVHCSLSDVTPYIISLMVNFLIIGFAAWLVLRSFERDWPLGLHTSGLVGGLKKYAFAGVAAGIFSCVAFIIGLAPFDYKPSVWKILIEGVYIILVWRLLRSYMSEVCSLILLTKLLTTRSAIRSLPYGYHQSFSD